MRNESDVKHILVAHLAADVPGRCQAIEAESGVETPAPELWLPHPAVDEVPPGWPVGFVSGAGRAGHRYVESDETGDQLFAVIYRFFVELWCLVDEHHDYGGVDDLRARLEQAVIESLLDDAGVGIGRASRLADHSIAVEEDSVVSRPSDIFETGAGLQAQAVEIEFRVVSVELLARAVLADPPITVDVDVVPLEEE